MTAYFGRYRPPLKAIAFLTVHTTSISKGTYSHISFFRGGGGGGSGPPIPHSGSTHVINAWAYDAEGSALVWTLHVA